MYSSRSTRLVAATWQVVLISVPVEVHAAAERAFFLFSFVVHPLALTFLCQRPANDQAWSPDRGLPRDLVPTKTYRQADTGAARWLCFYIDSSCCRRSYVLVAGGDVPDIVQASFSRSGSINARLSIGRIGHDKRLSWRCLLRLANIDV